MNALLDCEQMRHQPRYDAEIVRSFLRNRSIDVVCPRCSFISHAFSSLIFVFLFILNFPSMRNVRENTAEKNPSRYVPLNFFQFLSWECGLTYLAQIQTLLPSPGRVSTFGTAPHVLALFSLNEYRLDRFIFRF